MATIDPLALQAWAGVYEIFEPKSRIATRSLPRAGFRSLRAASRRFCNASILAGPFPLTDPSATGAARRAGRSDLAGVDDRPRKI
jgi:hypothetical protein